MAINKTKVLMHAKQTLLVIIGSLILSFASAIFYIPNSIVSGGMSGIAVIFNAALGWNEELVITIVTWAFFLVGALVLGKKFALQTLCSTIVYPIGVAVFLRLYENVDFLQLATSAIEGTSIANVNDLLAAIFGGILTGVGCAITFLGGGSTGGVDIPSLIVQKYAKIKVSRTSFVIDAMIIIAGIFVIKRFDLALIGIVAAYFAALMMDRVFFGGKSSYMAYIISDKYDDINNFILDEMERGTTLVDSQGGYSGHDFKMIQVCFDVKEYNTLKEAVESIDKKAFLSVVKAHEIRGEGFYGINALFDQTKLDEWIEKRKAAQNNDKEEDNGNE